MIYCLIFTDLNPNLPGPRASYEKELKKLGAMVENIIFGLGVEWNVISLYAEESCSWLRRNHAYCVGVADPTDALPEGTVFVTGMGVGSFGRKQQRVFMTRNPCTETSDGRVLRRITSKPKQMKARDWRMLCSLHFGIVIFASPRSGAKPLPETIAGGDLDGDPYLVCWDNDIISGINPAILGPAEPTMIEGIDEEVETNDPLLAASYMKRDEKGMMCKGWVGGKNEADEYIVHYENGRTETLSKEELVAGRDFVDKILGHREGKGGSIEVQILWNSGTQDWAKLKEMRREIPEHLFDYAQEKELMERSGWTWFKSYVRNAEIQEILGHRPTRKGKPAELHVKWDDGTTDWNTVQSLKPEDNEILDVDDIVVNYAQKENILGWKEFGWAKGHIGNLLVQSVSLCLLKFLICDFLYCC